MILQHENVYQYTRARRMTATSPLAEPETSPLSGNNSLDRQPRRPELEKTTYYCPRYRDNGWKLRDLPNNGRGETAYDS